LEQEEIYLNYLLKKGGIMEFKIGDLVTHKATRKRCVIKRLEADGSVVVTTQDDEMRVYEPHELEPAVH
jgi:hypothetical protein